MSDVASEAEALGGSGVKVACMRCSQPGRPVVMLETGQFTVTPAARNEYASMGHEIPREAPDGALGLRLKCPTCTTQILWFPVQTHYTCARCKYEHQTYMTGGTSAVPRGLSYNDQVEGSQQQSDALLEQLRNNSIGGWGL